MTQSPGFDPNAHDIKRTSYVEGTEPLKPLHYTKDVLDTSSKHTGTVQKETFPLPKLPPSTSEIKDPLKLAQSALTALQNLRPVGASPSPAAKPSVLLSTFLSIAQPTSTPKPEESANAAISLVEMTSQIHTVEDSVTKAVEDFGTMVSNMDFDQLMGVLNASDAVEKLQDQVALDTKTLASLKADLTTSQAALDKVTADIANLNQQIYMATLRSVCDPDYKASGAGPSGWNTSTQDDRNGRPIINPWTNQPNINPATGNLYVDPLSTPPYLPNMDPVTHKPYVDPQTGQPYTIPGTNPPIPLVDPQTGMPAIDHSDPGEEKPYLNPRTGVPFEDPSNWSFDEAQPPPASIWCVWKADWGPEPVPYNLIGSIHISWDAVAPFGGALTSARGVVADILTYKASALLYYVQANGGAQGPLAGILDVFNSNTKNAESLGANVGSDTHMISSLNSNLPSEKEQLAMNIQSLMGNFGKGPGQYTDADVQNVLEILNKQKKNLQAFIDAYFAAHQGNALAVFTIIKCNIGNTAADVQRVIGEQNFSLTQFSLAQINMMASINKAISNTLLQLKTFQAELSQYQHAADALQKTALALSTAMIAAVIAGGIASVASGPAAPFVVMAMAVVQLILGILLGGIEMALGGVEYTIGSLTEKIADAQAKLSKEKYTYAVAQANSELAQNLSTEMTDTLLTLIKRAQEMIKQSNTAYSSYSAAIAAQQNI